MYRLDSLQLQHVSRLKMYLNAFVALPRTPLGSLHRSPDPIAGFKGLGGESRVEREEGKG